MKNNIGARIKEFRSKAKLTQGALAEMLGVTNRAVSNWESGNNGVDVDLIPSICTALNVSPNDLLGTPSQKELSEEAISFAKSFDALDAPGKAVMQAVLKAQQQRIMEYGPAVKSQSGEIVRKRLPMIQGTHEAEIQMRYQSRQEQRELQQSESLQSDPT